MNVEDLLKKYNGQKVAGKAICRINNKNVIVGKCIDGNYILTDEGKMADAVEEAEDAVVVEETPKPKKRTRAKKKVEPTPGLADGPQADAELDEVLEGLS